MNSLELCASLVYDFLTVNVFVRSLAAFSSEIAVANFCLCSRKRMMEQLEIDKIITNASKQISVLERLVASLLIESGVNYENKKSDIIIMENGEFEEGYSKLGDGLDNVLSSRPSFARFDVPVDDNRFIPGNKKKSFANKKTTSLTHCQDTSLTKLQLESRSSTPVICSPKKSSPLAAILTPRVQQFTSASCDQSSIINQKAFIIPQITTESNKTPKHLSQQVKNINNNSSDPNGNAALRDIKGNCDTSEINSPVVDNTSSINVDKQSTVETDVKTRKEMLEKKMLLGNKEFFSSNQSKHPLTDLLRLQNSYQSNKYHNPETLSATFTQPVDVKDKQAHNAITDDANTATQFPDMESITSLFTSAIQISPETARTLRILCFSENVNSKIERTLIEASFTTFTTSSSQNQRSNLSFPNYFISCPHHQLAAFYACIQAEMLKVHLYDECKQKQFTKSKANALGVKRKSDSRSIKTDELFGKNEFAFALSNILWRCGNYQKAVICLPLQNFSGNDPKNNKSKTLEFLTENMIQYTVETKDNLLEFLNNCICLFIKSHGSAVLFLYSAVLSRGIEACIHDISSGIDESMTLSAAALSSIFDVSVYHPSTPLSSIVYDCNIKHEHQILINLLLTGRAVQHAFNDCVIINEQNIQGIHTRSDIGFLSDVAASTIYEVGSYYKTPKFPIWIVRHELLASEIDLQTVNENLMTENNDNHLTIQNKDVMIKESDEHNFLYSILYCKKKQLLSDWKCELLFQLFHFQVTEKYFEAYFTIDTRRHHMQAPAISEDDYTCDNDIFIASLDKCIRFKWKDAVIVRDQQ